MLSPLTIVACRHCSHEISATALMCPACAKFDDSRTNLAIAAKRAVRWLTLIGAAAIGPNAVVGAILGPEMNRPKQSVVARIARAIDAIDSVDLGNDFRAFFTRTGFVAMFLYDLGRHPDIPQEVPYSCFLGAEILPSTPPGTVHGRVTYQTPGTFTFKRPHRPTPLERIILGKKMYEDMIKAADSFDENARPENCMCGFWFEGQFAPARANYVCQKFYEYAGQ